MIFKMLFKILNSMILCTFSDPIYNFKQSGNNCVSNKVVHYREIHGSLYLELLITEIRNLKEIFLFFE